MHTFRLARPLMVLTLGALAYVALAAKLPKIEKGGSVVASLTADGGAPDADSFEASVSNNGRYVAFYTEAENLVTPDTNNRYDIFVRDRKKGTVELISRTPTGTPGDEQSYYPAMSANGRFLIYVTEARDIVPIPGDDPANLQLVFHDRKKGTSRLVSAGPNGDASNARVNTYDTRPLSGNGRWAVFASDADNLIANDDNQHGDIFIADLRKGTLRRLFEGTDGPPNGSSDEPSISPNGRFVVFTSDASNLVEGDENGESDVFLYDLRKRRMQIVSVNSAGEQADGDSAGGAPSVDNRGRYVAFRSRAENLSEEADTNNVTDVFLRDLRKGTTKRISMGPQGAQADANAGDTAITPNGKLVLWWTNASNMVDATDTIPYDHVVYDVRTGTIRRLLPATDGGAPNDGVYGYWAGLSANGKWATTASDATNVDDEGDAGVWDVYLIRLR